MAAETTENMMNFVPKVTFELIPIKNLVSNQEYQRNLSETHILRAAEEFDLYQINPVKVSRREGVNYVFNGQHTIEIVALVSGSRETPVWCMIYDDMNYKVEAHVFADQQKFVKALVPYEIFMAHIEAQDQKYLMIQDLVESYNLKILPGMAAGGICAVGTLEKIYDRYGYHILDRTLRLCVGTWEGEINSFSGNILSAIARMAFVYGDDMEDDIFKDHVGKSTVKAIGRMAKDRRPGSLGYAEAMVIAYNMKCKKNLPMKKLYGKNYDEDEDFDDKGEENNEELPSPKM